MTGPAAPAPEPGAWAMYRALVGVGVTCALLIVGAFEITRPAIRRNRIDARQRAVLDVLRGARSSRAFRWNAGHFEPTAADREGSDMVFAGYDGTGHLVGVAIEGQTMGYQDVIQALFGYSPAEQAIVGMRVLESRETPGLGDRIETDPAFLRNFQRLDVSVDASADALRHPIVAVKSGAKHSPWEIDCITGATISSSAVARMTAASAARWVPRIARHLSDFQGTE